MLRLGGFRTPQSSPAHPWIGISQPNTEIEKMKKTAEDLAKVAMHQKNYILAQVSESAIIFYIWRPLAEKSVKLALRHCRIAQNC